jgi:hypothetical protein
VIQAWRLRALSTLLAEIIQRLALGQSNNPTDFLRSQFADGPQASAPAATGLRMRLQTGRVACDGRHSIHAEVASRNQNAQPVEVLVLGISV